MHTLTRISHEDAQFLQRQKWLQKNQGVLSGVARELGVSGAHVSKVWRKIDRNARIEAHLTELNAPGFQKLERSA